MYQADMKTSEKPLTNTPKDAKICMEPIIGTASDEASTNLDNANNSAQPFVQMSREVITSNGCHVKLIFRKESMKLRSISISILKIFRPQKVLKKHADM